MNRSAEVTAWNRVQRLLGTASPGEASQVGPASELGVLCDSVNVRWSHFCDAKHIPVIHTHFTHVTDFPVEGRGTSQRSLNKTLMRQEGQHLIQIYNLFDPMKIHTECVRTGLRMLHSFPVLTEFSFPSPPLPLRPSPSQTAQTVLVVVVVFGISWLPHHIVHLWAEFGVFPLTPASFLFRILAHCLAYSNSSVNPIIYAFLSENFRKAYKQVFKCHLRHESPLNDTKENKSRMDTPPSTHCTHV